MAEEQSESAVHQETNEINETKDSTGSNAPEEVDHVIGPEESDRHTEPKAPGKRSSFEDLKNDTHGQQSQEIKDLEPHQLKTSTDVGVSKESELEKLQVTAGDECQASETTVTSTDDTETGVASRRLHGARLVIVELCLCLGLLLSIVDASIISTAIVTISHYFDNFDKTTWIILSYLLSYMSFSIIWARGSDLIGRKYAVVAAWIIFTAFSLGCGLANSMDQLIAFRSLQGIGGAGLYSMTNIVIPEITPKKHFATMSGATGGVFAVSSVLGPVLGGIICDRITWRWIFLLNVPCGAVVVLVILISWPDSVDKRSLQLHKVSVMQIDFVGTILLMAATVLLVVAMQEAGTSIYGWNSSVIIGLLCGCGLSVAGIIGWTAILELSRDKTLIIPTFPFRFLQQRIILTGFLVALLTGFPLFLTLIQIPERFQIVNRTSTIGAGVRLMPLLFASAFGSSIAGFCSSRENNTFWTLLAASSLMLIGSGLLSSLSTSFNISAANYGYQVIFGLGIGMTFSTVIILVSLEAEFKDYSIALGIVNQARILGGVIGLAVSTIIFNIHVGQDLSSILEPQQIQALRQSLNVLPTFSQQQQEAVRETFAKSFDEQLRVCTYLAAVCWVVVWGAWSKTPVDLAKRKEAYDALIEGRVPEGSRER